MRRITVAARKRDPQAYDVQKYSNADLRNMKPVIATPAILTTLAQGRYLSVWQQREQIDRDGIEWADYHGRARSDETVPVLRTKDAVVALAQLEAVRADATMGGHRYGSITAGNNTIALITRKGRIFAGLNVRLEWCDGTFKYVCDGKA